MFEDLDDLEDEDGGAAEALAAAALPPPRQRAECFGFEEAEQALLRAYQDGRLPHAIILAGPEGVGKATFAFRMARFLLKSRPKRNGGDEGGLSLFGTETGLPTQPFPRGGEGLSMDVPADDPVFRQVASGGHNDLLVIERLFDEKKGRTDDTIKIDEVRRVTPFLRMTAGQGGWRVVVIDDADTMPGHTAQNAILKILEEPPPNALLILVAHNIGGLLPTVRSRCRVIHCRPPEKDVFARLLRGAQPGLSDRDSDTLHAVTGGSIGRALRLQQEGGLEAIARVTALLESWPAWNWPEIHALADNMSRPEQADSFRAFEEIFLWIAESLVRARAQDRKLPAPLAAGAAARIAGQYPLEALLELCDNLKNHFATADRANLDKRQTVLGAFSIFSARKAA